MNITSSRRLVEAAAVSLGLLTLLASCRAPRVAEVSVAELVQSGYYEKAYDLAEEQAREKPRDAQAQQTFAEMSVIVELERGRRTLFEGHAEDALHIFEGAQVLDPANATVASWIAKTRRQLAENWLDVGQNLTGNEQLNQAEEAFERVLQYDPDSATAAEGLARVLLRQQYREGLGLTYYRDGLRALRDFEFWGADRDLGLATEYDESLERARRRQEEVRQAIIEQRIARAEELERNGHYYASRNEFRLALLLDPDNEVASEGMDRMDLEVRTERMLGEVDMDIRRGEIEDAKIILEQGTNFSEAQKDDFTKLEGRVEDAYWRTMYDEAISLYQDQLFVEAVVKFDELLEETEFFEDAVTRRRTLVGWITDADKLYAEAATVDDPQTQLDLYRQIQVFWAEYRDVRDLIAALEKQLGTEGGE